MTCHAPTGFLLIHHHIDYPGLFGFQNGKCPGVIQDIPDHSFAW
jgi:hypothetical protein